MAKKKRKRINPKKLKPEERLRNAEKWLCQPHVKINDLIPAYCKRYNVSSTDAHYELLELGYRDELAIQAYEKEGIEWEYMHDGYTGLDLVVPKGTKDWELHEFYLKLCQPLRGQRTGKTTPFITFSQSSLNFTFASSQVVFAFGHAERYVPKSNEEKYKKAICPFRFSVSRLNDYWNRFNPYGFKGKFIFSEFVSHGVQCVLREATYQPIKQNPGGGVHCSRHTAAPSTIQT